MTKGILEKKNKKSIDKENVKRMAILGLSGLILILIPDTLNKLVGIVVGIMLLLQGLSIIIPYFKDKIGTTLSLASGILYCTLGAIVITYPNSVLRLVAICLGVYLLIAGLVKLSVSLNMKDFNEKWICTFVISLLIIILGLLLIFNPFSGIAITKITGIFLLITTILDVLDTYILQK